MKKIIYSLIVVSALILGGALGGQAWADCLGGQYVDYAAESFHHDEGTHRVLYFHAPWCPSCVAGDRDLKKFEIPSDITVFKVDYDSSKDLKKKYGVVKQHTFVLVDEKGEKVSIWSGGVDSIIEKVKGK